MAKYENLIKHLKSLNQDVWAPTFPEIEKILGASLPPSAYQYAAWWSNQTSEGHSQSRAWQDTGWRTANLDLPHGCVTFVRINPLSTEATRPIQNATESISTAPDHLTMQGISIPEAKMRLAIYFGVSSENIEITIRG